MTETVEDPDNPSPLCLRWIGLRQWEIEWGLSPNRSALRGRNPFYCVADTYET